ncbi:MAG: MFS family permease [Gammaproteobacteria bacterium]|jgi:MFS family permease
MPDFLSQYNRPVIYLALAEILVWAGLYYSFPALLLEWESGFGWHRSELTLAITTSIVVSAFFAPISGRLIDRGLGAYLMTGCTFFGGAGLIFLSMVEQLWQFYLCWIFIGIMLSGCLYDPCFTLITRRRGANARSAIVMITLVAGFAGTISFPTAHALSETYGWRTTILCFAMVILFVASPLMWVGSRRIEAEAADISIKDNKSSGYGFLRHRVFWFLAVGFGLAAMLHGVTLHHLLPVLDERSVDPGFAVLIASLIGPMQVAGRLLMTIIQHKVSNHGMVFTCFILLTGSVVVLNLAGASPVGLILFVTLFGSAYGMVSIVRPVIAREMLGQSSFGAKFGLLSMVYLFGGASAPFVGALLWSIGGYDLVLPTLLIAGVGGMLAYGLAHRYSKAI